MRFPPSFADLCLRFFFARACPLHGMPKLLAPLSYRLGTLQGSSNQIGPRRTRQSSVYKRSVLTVSFQSSFGGCLKNGTICQRRHLNHLNYQASENQSHAVRHEISFPWRAMSSRHRSIFMIIYSIWHCIKKALKYVQIIIMKNHDLRSPGYRAWKWRAMISDPLNQIENFIGS